MNTNNISYFFDIFKNQENGNDGIAERLIPQNTLYDDISRDILSSVINGTENKRFFLVENYSSFNNDGTITIHDEPNFNYSKWIEIKNKETNLDLSWAPDDIIILSETDNSFWYLYNSRSHDCDIGRVNKRLFKDFDEYEKIMIEKSTTWGKKSNIIKIDIPCNKWIVL